MYGLDIEFQWVPQTGYKTHSFMKDWLLAWLVRHTGPLASHNIFICTKLHFHNSLKQKLKLLGLWFEFPCINYCLVGSGEDWLRFIQPISEAITLCGLWWFYSATNNLEFCKIENPVLNNTTFIITPYIPLKIICSNF